MGFRLLCLLFSGCFLVFKWVIVKILLILTGSLLSKEQVRVGKKKLVVELDKTLFYCSKAKIEGLRYDFFFSSEGETFFAYKRPYLEAFLEKASKIFDIVVFTTMSQQTANTVLEGLDPRDLIKTRFYRDSCKINGNCLVKDLSDVALERENVLILDSDPAKYLEDSGCPLNSRMSDCETF